KRQKTEPASRKSAVKRKVASPGGDTEQKRTKRQGQKRKTKAEDTPEPKRSKSFIKNKLKRPIDDDTRKIPNKRAKLAPKKRGIASEDFYGGKRRKIETTKEKAKKSALKKSAQKNGPVKKIKWLGY
ncbi:MAG: hypothetical protein ACRDCT_12220, partial [Shewanella sp.]